MNETRAQTDSVSSHRRPRNADTRLQGGWLIFARVAWAALVLFVLGLFVVSLPVSFAILHMPCAAVSCTSTTGQLTSGDIRTLQQLGFSLDTYVSFWGALNVGVALVWFVVGVLLAWRKSDDWMVLLVALMLISFGANFTTDTLLITSSIWRLPANGLYLINLSILFTFALFPNGRFVPRWIGWIALVYPATLMFYLVFLRQLHVPGWSLYRNPLNAFAWFGCLGALTLAQLYRYLRVSNQVERQQTKWVAFSFIVFGTASFVGTAVAHSQPIQQVGLLYLLITSLFTCLYLIVPLSFGVAILRYRLWDIDIIINRTLVYGSLTALLALLYFGLIFVLQSLFQGLFKQNNAVAIVVSTLVIAALFQPLRHRIQRFIDRRFYRSKYDAAKTLEAFSATLRNEVDLGQLREHLLDVVQETMQPAHVSLWLRSPGRHTEEPRRLEKPNTMEEGF
jgi:hypothetical protein